MIQLRDQQFAVPNRIVPPPNQRVLVGSTSPGSSWIFNSAGIGVHDIKFPNLPVCPLWPQACKSDTESMQGATLKNIVCCYYINHSGEDGSVRLHL